jgi:hypothetical protein
LYSSLCNFSDDDITVLYIGNNAISPSDANYNKLVVYQNTVAQSSYTVSLTAGQYYPIRAYYSQGNGAKAFGLGDNSNYYYSLTY